MRVSTLGKEYALNPQRLFQIVEEFRKLGNLGADSPVPRDETVEAGAVRPPAAPPGPALVLVHGVREGKAFPLRRQDLRDGRGWVVGRKPSVHVALEYDPYVSTENSEVLIADGRYRILDLRSSKNGTWLNWRRLEPDERAALRPGDVAGVGRSLLVFRDD